MAYKGKGTIVNRAGLADVFGAATPTVDTWVRRGCPFVQRGGRGKEWQFNTAAVSEWLRDQAREEVGGTVFADESELKRRKLAAETSLAELELAKAKGAVAPLEEVEREVANAFATVKANMRNIPGRVVTLLIGETEERRFKTVLLAEIDQALEALADADLAGVDDVTEDEEE